METPSPPPLTARIDERLAHRIGVREWGYPSLLIPGKLWRSAFNHTITCTLPADEDTIRFETLPLVIVPAGEDQWIPDSWRDALWAYTQEWPSSGCIYGPLLRISAQQRHAFLVELGSLLVTSDEIGSRSIADDIGHFASLGYNLEEPTPPTTPDNIMHRRPLTERFNPRTQDKIKVTTIRDTLWPLHVPIMLYNWTGTPYHSPQRNFVAVRVMGYWPIVITHTPNGKMQYEHGMDCGKPLWQTEGFDDQADMDRWFSDKVRPGTSSSKILHRFRVLHPQECPTPKPKP